MNPRFRMPALIASSVVVALCVGLLLGGHPSWLPTPLRDIFVDGSVATRTQIIDEIHDNFYKPVKKSSLEAASLKGIVASLHDRYSEYFTPSEAKAFTQSINGQFEGVGMTIDSSDTKKGLLVRMVFAGSPAKQAGIAPGDVIVAVNGKTTLGKPADVSTGLIRGPAGTSVTLGIRRHGTAPMRSVKVQRKKID